MFAYFMLVCLASHMGTAQMYPGLDETAMFDAVQVFEDVNTNDDSSELVETVDSYYEMKGTPAVAVAEAEPLLDTPAQGRQIGVDLLPNVLGSLGGGDDDTTGDESSCCYGTSKITQIAGVKNKVPSFTLDNMFGTTLLSFGGIALTAAAVLGGLAAFGLVPLGGIGTALTTAIAGLGFGDAFARQGLGFDNRENHVHAHNEHHHQFHDKAQQKFEDYYQYQQQ